MAVARQTLWRRTREQQSAGSEASGVGGGGDTGSFLKPIGMLLLPTVAEWGGSENAPFSTNQRTEEQAQCLRPISVPSSAFGKYCPSTMFASFMHHAMFKRENQVYFHVHSKIASEDNPGYSMQTLSDSYDQQFLANPRPRRFIEGGTWVHWGTQSGSRRS
jgi:hypothetical protein